MAGPTAAGEGLYRVAFYQERIAEFYVDGERLED
jgi:hypothetical protein